MLIDIDGEKKEVAFSAIDADSLRNDKDYNTELDRIIAGKTNTFETQYKAEHETTLSQLKSDHAAELETAKKVNSGKRDDVIEGMTTQIETITKTMQAFEQRAIDAELSGKTGSLKTELTSAMMGVPDEYWSLW